MIWYIQGQNGGFSPPVTFYSLVRRVCPWDIVERVPCDYVNVFIRGHLLVGSRVPRERSRTFLLVLICVFNEDRFPCVMYRLETEVCIVQEPGRTQWLDKKNTKKKTVCGIYICLPLHNQFSIPSHALRTDLRRVTRSLTGFINPTNPHQVGAGRSVAACWRNSLGAWQLKTCPCRTGGSVRATWRLVWRVAGRRKVGLVRGQRGYGVSTLSVQDPAVDCLLNISSLTHVSESCPPKVESCQGVVLVVVVVVVRSLILISEAYN